MCVRIHVHTRNAHLRTYNLFLYKLHFGVLHVTILAKHMVRESEIFGGGFCFIHFYFKSLGHRKYLIKCLFEKNTFPPWNVWFEWIAELAASAVPTAMTRPRTWAPRSSWMPSPKTLASGPDVWKETPSRECRYDTLHTGFSCLSPALASHALYLLVVCHAVTTTICPLSHFLLYISKADVVI